MASMPQRAHVSLTPPGSIPPRLLVLAWFAGPRARSVVLFVLNLFARMSLLWPLFSVIDGLRLLPLPPRRQHEHECSCWLLVQCSCWLLGSVRVGCSYSHRRPLVAHRRYGCAFWVSDDTPGV